MGLAPSSMGSERQGTHWFQVKAEKRVRSMEHKIVGTKQK